MNNPDDPLSDHQDRLARTELLLGTVAASDWPGRDGGLRIETDDPALEAHLSRSRPWFRAYVRRHCGTLGNGPGGRVKSGARVAGPRDGLSRHAVLIGASGAGKTRSALSSKAWHLKSGGSLIAMTPKYEDLMADVDLARRSGLAPEQVVVVSPRFGAIPGWNVLDGRGDVPPAKTASSFVSILKAANSSSWGPRLENLLHAAATVICAHGLSIYELARFIQDDGDYRTALLSAPPKYPGGAAYSEAQRFFSGYDASWSKSGRNEASATLLNKILGYLRNDFSSAMLCASETDIDVAALWREQRLLAVHLDEHSMGAEGAAAIAGFLSARLFATASEIGAASQVPVLFAVDEVGLLGGLVSDALVKTLVVGRSQRLQLLLMAQHFGQLTPELEAAAMGNAATFACFRLGYADARQIAQSLSAGAAATGGPVSVAAAATDRRTGLPETASWHHPILDERGKQVRLRDAALWESVRSASIHAHGTGPARGPVGTLARAAAAQGRRLYVRSADTGEPVEICRYVMGVPATACGVSGPSPLALSIEFPRPKVSSAARHGGDLTGQWAKTIQSLPHRHCVLRVDGADPVVAKTPDAPPCSPPDDPAFARFLDAVRRATGQSDDKIAATRRERQMAIDRLARGEAQPAAADSDVPRQTRRPVSLPSGWTGSDEEDVDA